MYAVIFRATVKQLDTEYSATAERMRELAMDEYGCTEFVSTLEGRNEIAISYWPSLAAIQSWRKNEEHLAAQTLGKSTWYESYSVQVVEVLREYGA